MNSATFYNHGNASLSHFGGHICRWIMATGPELLYD